MALITAGEDWPCTTTEVAVTTISRPSSRTCDTVEAITVWPSTVTRPRTRTPTCSSSPPRANGSIVAPTSLLRPRRSTYDTSAVADSPSTGTELT